MTITNVCRRFARLLENKELATVFSACRAPDPPGENIAAASCKKELNLIMILSIPGYAGASLDY